MGNNITYSLQELFDINLENSVLRLNEAVKYYIPPYQRGYKWSSEGSDSQVNKLMTDLFTAFDNKKKEYYLQYITVRKPDGGTALELIDGQQRLTTLTILLSVLQEKRLPNEPCIANNLLSYEVRDTVLEFFNEYIYKDINKILDGNWSDFISLNEKYDEQDICYIFEAARLINRLLIEKLDKLPDGYKIFAEYILLNVKILLNTINRGSPEEIFSNLNGNKVDLKNSELLKGLFLTYSARGSVFDGKKISYKEMLELRSKMGRQWDEISHWINTEEIDKFFFSKIPVKRETPIESFLLAFALTEGFKQEDRTKNDIYNYFETKINNKYEYATAFFTKMVLLKLILNDWYCDKDIHDRLGYLFAFKGNKDYSLADFLQLIQKTKTEVKKELKEKISEILQNADPLTAEYGGKNDDIHNILLALNVFDNNFPFDFYQYVNCAWTLEHIFPQNPKKFPEKIGPKDLELIKSLLHNSLAEYDAVKDKLSSLYIDEAESVYNGLKVKIKDDCQKYNEDEIKIIYALMKTNKLNAIGNMALLENRDNISNSNGMFDNKRINVVKRVSEGSFVPRHTYDVFSKLLSPQMSQDLITWNEKDINAHTDYILSKIKSIQENL